MQLLGANSGGAWQLRSETASGTEPASASALLDPCGCTATENAAERSLIPARSKAPAAPGLREREGSSDTSSETSEDSDSSPSCPQGPCSEENLNYTSLVFPGKAHGPGSPGDYENMKTRADYVNVDPKKRNVDFWPCSSPVASKSIEYTEVKL
ncbi:PREDICTED: uncharacterized protein C1orf186 homolog [Aptenodytes forsteri]|uniref:uncharacterized protein C1orf186 homolog n=1 Tax=Aptenodytes forsteri TaxID=9233 RepID=UPI0009057D27|nr:PREDICTED: uncharacterized protein C1orf186 homolog [Aptenodytes forsteri]